MPGDAELLKEFTADLRPRVLGQLVTEIFEKMKLADELGSLQKIEEEIATLVREAKRQWRETPKPEQENLFSEMMKPTKATSRFDPTGVTDEQFWDTAEQRIYEELRAYAEQSEAGYSHRLFADDAARGFAFIDVCRRRYDVVLMNPPFGDATKSTKSYVAARFPKTKNDVYAAFVEQGLSRLIFGGCLGAITSRTGFYLGSFQKWREEVLLRASHPIVLADLGHGVLDAMVETATYVLQKIPRTAEVVDNRDSSFTVFIRLLTEENKNTALLDALKAVSQGRQEAHVFAAIPQRFADIPSSPFAYWVRPKVLELFKKMPHLEAGGRRVERGLFTGDDFRFLRLFWEINPVDIKSGRWGLLSKGGAFARYYADVYLAVLCDKSFAQIRAAVVAKYLYLDGNSDWVLHPECSYGRPGLTYPLRTTSDFSVRCLPGGCFWSNKGISVFERADQDIDRDSLFGILALMNSSVFRGLLALRMGAGDAAARSYEEGIVAEMPWPSLTDAQLKTLSRQAEQAYRLSRKADRTSEISHAFAIPYSLAAPADSIATCANSWTVELLNAGKAVGEIQAQIDDFASVFYGFDPVDRKALESSVGLSTVATGSSEKDSDDQEDDTSTADPYSVANDLLSYAIGAAFGRWDVRIGMRPESVSDPVDPFKRLALCPPSQLQNIECLPLNKDDIQLINASGQGDYPLDVPWDGVLVTDEINDFDIERRIRRVLELIWRDRAEAVEQDICTCLRVNSLREFVRRPSGFFADHLKKYSKSRRQAPIYWPLSTSSGSYTLWLYYPRLTAQTLHTCLADFVDPKLKSIAADIQNLRATNGAQARLSELLDFQDELNELRTDIESVIKLPYEPNLDDGVLITASPLWKLFRLPKWQKQLKACWEELASGDYDWAQVALSIWPDRVKQKCKKDRSIAIAHNLENLCEVGQPKPKVKKNPAKQASLVNEDAN